ncbi:MAG: hypothetical protein A2148_12390 [Chloroflexi bacterium RBG_16_68_14]|nr:MAG: hypothetical protein A2148_12390 [Chloroflexi bacterium RBG_16_68_14]
MRMREQRALVIGLLASDAMMLLWASASALGVRYGVSRWPGGPESSSSGLALLLLAPALTLALMAAGGLYRLDDLFSGHREYAGVVRGCTYAAFAVLLLAFLLDVNLSRGALILSWGLSCFLVGSERFLFRRGVYRLRRSGRLVRRAIIIGADEHAIAIARRLSNPAAGWQAVGFLDDYQPTGAEVVDGLRVLGDPRAAAELALTYGASDLILVPHAVSWEAQRDLLEMAATSDQPALRLAPGLYHLLATGARPLEANFVPLLSLERLRITGLDATLKTAVDYGLSLATLPALGALLGALCLAARLSGGGALLERRPALGLRSKPFHLLTIAPPPQEVARGQPSLGWRLREAAASGRLSKLPNILNILRGRMSLVGPRALTASADLLHRPWSRTLLLVRPGLTGPHLASGNDWSAEEQAILDVAYVRDYSLWLDLRLLFASLMRMLRRERLLPASYQRQLSDQPVPTESLAP